MSKVFGSGVINYIYFEKKTRKTNVVHRTASVVWKNYRPSERLGSKKMNVVRMRRFLDFV
jgi:hypothetical protein